MRSAPGQEGYRILLSEEDKEELIDEILRLREENEKLRKENEELKKKEEESKRHQVARLMRRKRKRRWKKLGRPAGYPGSTRKKPTDIDHTVEVTLDRCPDCGSEDLSRMAGGDQEHVQEDIVPARVEATKFIRRAYWCATCHKGEGCPLWERGSPLRIRGTECVGLDDPDEIRVWTALQQDSEAV